MATDMRRFTVTNPASPLLTMNRRGHWAKDDPDRAWWRDFGRVHGIMLKARGGPIPTPVRVVVSIHWPDKRHRDSNNYAQTGKAIVDGLVTSGLLPDDDDKHLVGPDMRRIPKHGDHLYLSVVIYTTELAHEAAPTEGNTKP